MLKVSVIGLGKLGAPMAAVYASKGFDVIGVDKNPAFVDAINHGRAPVEEDRLQDFIDQSKGRLSATLDTAEAVKNTDITFVIVPTPSGPDGSFTNKYVLESLKEIGAGIKGKEGYHLVVITSTVMPGSTDGEIRQTLEKYAGRPVGETLGLCYSPEFIALGTVIRDMLNPDFFLIGESDKKAGDLLVSIYSQACDNQPRMERMNFVNAELTKISVNTFVTTKISYANMLSDLCDYLPGADVDVVTQAIGCDSRIGHKYLKGAVAYGGPCFPRDNVAFSRLAEIIGANADLAVATDTINRHQKDRVLAIIDQLDYQPKTIGILGLSYKPGTSVIEESQGVGLAASLKKQGFNVVVFDPMAMAPAKAVLGEHARYAASAAECVSESDAIVIMTAWPEFAELTASLFDEKPAGFAVIDCWRILKPETLPAKTASIHLGRGVLAQLATAKERHVAAS
ncbi:UDP-glucose dehydrogenase family protein [Candidatus Finniella inopinata]|uniref:UDP-glucose 6-dehydrogenase n=1 Tax=Candidatus Finniella inopinata TaxID=1696036 RepID=A0A4Q7DK19_9PROT|nr:nucleotide sugar dehydrogenase [Candidatus Finniella inopinata]RZI47102.1 UDP-glucose/GDP-mannose dehydrogenase family protein [Candidatus Finniella inopinata]